MMRTMILSLLTFGGIGLLAGNADAQLIYPGYQVYRPVVARPVVVAQPVIVGRRVVVARPVVPVVTGYAPVAAAPVTAYYAPAPVVVTRRRVVVAPAPVVAYRPAVVGGVAAVPVAPVPVAPVVVGRPVRLGRGIVGQPKVYRPGQPIRNTFRFVTP